MDSKQDMAKRLIIIGNGFDLCAGLHSSFLDYFNSKDSSFVDNFNKVWDKLDASTEDKNMIIVNICTIIDGGRGTSYTNLETLSKDSEFNFWEYVLLLQKSKLSNWSDIESTLGNFLSSDKRDALTFKNVNSSLTELKECFDRNHQYPQFGYMKSSELRNFHKMDTDTCFMIFVMMYIFDFKIQEYSKQKLYEFLLNQLNKFEDSFKDYLIKQSTANRPYDEKCVSLLQELRHDESFNLLSFNYTVPTVIKYNADSLHLVHLRNVHSTLSDSPIIGIDQNLSNSSDNFQYHFTKTFRTMRLASDRNEQILLTKSINTIVFFGHSLSAADYSYFQSIFDYFDIYGTDITLVFYYSVYDTDLREKITETQFDAIAKLIKAYGGTLSNDDHGKNLLHKLLLEGRLIIKELK